MEKLKWHKYPQETPPKISGKLTDCLIKGISAATHHQAYWNAFWVWEESDRLKGFFMNGNEFWGQTETNEFEWLTCEEIDNATKTD